MRRKHSQYIYSLLFAIVLVASGIYVLDNQKSSASVTCTRNLTATTNNFGWQYIKVGWVSNAVGSNTLVVWEGDNTTAAAYFTPSPLPAPSTRHTVDTRSATITAGNTSFRFEYSKTYHYYIETRTSTTCERSPAYAGTMPAPPPTPTPTPTPNPAPIPTPPFENNGSTYEETNTSQGNEDVVSIVEDTSPPTSPSNLTAIFVEDRSVIQISWSPSTDDNQVTGYEIERVEKGGTDWQKVESTETENYDDFIFESQKVYQYRVRAYDQVNNFSEYTNVVEVTAGAFNPNVTMKEGGVASDQDGKMSLEFTPSSVSEDLFVSIEKSDNRDFSLDDNTKIVGDVFEVRAKNNRGDKITKFNSQINIKFIYSTDEAKGANTSTLKIATVNDGKIEYLRTKLDSKNKESRTLTDHLSIYLQIAEKSSVLITFLRVLLWLLVMIAIAFAGYQGWTYYQRQKYQREHREDYIYKH